MRTLGSIKKQAIVMKEQVRVAELELQGSEVTFAENPSKENALALERARENYKMLYYQHESIESYIEHYDFYRKCEQQEREEAECRRMYAVA
ncbi:MAG: hypothetical protein IKP36_05000 [Bacteroidaceae bacterium]|nr:hypothetical protein [Prevotella sp.]MBR6031303.1 hypothetical protein [Bacteroidaceae bacterium]